MQCSSRNRATYTHPLLSYSLQRGRRRFDFLQRVAKIGNILERAINGRKTDVRNLVKLVELLHHHFADLPRWYFALPERKHLLHDPIDCTVDVFGWYRSFVQSALKTYANAFDVKICAIAV